MERFSNGPHGRFDFHVEGRVLLSPSLFAGYPEEPLRQQAVSIFISEIGQSFCWVRRESTGLPQIAGPIARREVRKPHLIHKVVEDLRRMDERLL